VEGEEERERESDLLQLARRSRRRVAVTFGACVCTSTELTSPVRVVVIVYYLL
jgi:hypothetical protein